MNAEIFMNYYTEIDIPDLMERAMVSEDDIGSVLRIHLLCERMIEAWICAHCSCPTFFGAGDSKVRIECSDKIAMAYNLGMDRRLYSTFKTINSLRNALAHNPNQQSIPAPKIQSMAATLGEYMREHGEDISQVRVATFAPDGAQTLEISLASDNSHNRMKLYLIFGSLMRHVAKVVASNHTGRWDNDFSQHNYNMTR